MDDFNLWWYLIAAVIYFFTRGKKKPKEPADRPGTGGNRPAAPAKSFEDLLREITEGRLETEVEPTQTKPVTREERPKPTPVESFKEEGRTRAFADEESRRVYEESIKMAEGADLKFEQADPFKSTSLFKGDKGKEEEEWTIADDIRDGLSSNEARKAIIYSEILTRKF